MVSRLDEDSFLSGANATFVAELYERYLKNPASGSIRRGRGFSPGSATRKARS